MASPFEVVRQFERGLAEYCGAPFAVSTTSCTMALLLVLEYLWSSDRIKLTLPRRTYVGVGHSARNAAYDLTFEDMDWVGEYQLKPLPVWDCARWLRAGMYRPGQYMTVSMHWSKHLGIGQGGAILHDDPDADVILRRMRFDGRKEGGAPEDVMADWRSCYHAYMSPRDAAEGLTRLALLPQYNDPLPWGPGTTSDYPDLSEIFK